MIFTKHVVMYSGGIGSYMAAKRVVEKYGAENTILLFSDTSTEDEDLYRFVDETKEKLGAEFVCLKDGRDIWEVFKDVKYIGNSRIAPCTRILKQEPARKWVKENFKPDEVTLYVGIDWTEYHRMAKIIKNWAPYNVEAPMCKEPYMCKMEMLDELKNENIKAPRLYKMGFSHNNCGGFCVKAGQGHFIKLLKTMPERFAYHEQKEQEMIEFLGSNVAILKRTKNGVTSPYTLKQLREEYESKPEQIDMFDIGGCGCFIDD